MLGSRRDDPSQGRDMTSPTAASTPRRFPNPVYAREILEVGFREAQGLLFPHLAASNVAHALMLAECGILPESEVAVLLTSLATIADEGAASFHYEPAVEDLFFAVERRLIALAGPEIGGNLQLARSRNDLAAGMNRLFLRDHSLMIQRTILRMRERLLTLADEHIRTIMPGITHTQPAQPTTLAHYLLGVLGPLERDSERLRDGWQRINRSPLGVAAFTTTTFPIDRAMIADLLGFDGIVENGYDAVGAGDHLLEAALALVTLVSGISRFVYDLLVWARRDVEILRIADEFIQISSIMPQKRNPVVLEHVRARLAYVYGEATSVSTMIHSSAFGDTNDVEDQIFVPVVRAFAAARSVLDLLDAVLATAVFDVELLANRAGQGGTTATALADGLVQQFGLPFRLAHQVVSSLVTDGSGFTGARVSERATALAGRPIVASDAWVAERLDPWVFVNERTGLGGPAPSAVETAIATARDRLTGDRAAVDAFAGRIARAADRRAGQAEALVQRVGAGMPGRESGGS
jgi:argininosuccinate lyase